MFKLKKLAKYLYLLTGRNGAMYFDKKYHNTI